VNDDERIAHEVGKWACEDVRDGMEHLRRTGFEERLRRRLAGRGPAAPRCRWLPLAIGAALATLAALVLFFHPFANSCSNREAVRSFFADYSSLKRARSTVVTIPSTARRPTIKAVSISQEELKNLLSDAIPGRNMEGNPMSEPETPGPAPRELRRTFDLFFSMALKTIKEKT